MLCSLISSAFSDFGLDKVPHGGADDGLVVSGDVVLGYFALVDDLLLSEEVCGVALLQECVSFVFLVGENGAHGLVMPGLFPAAV